MTNTTTDLLSNLEKQYLNAKQAYYNSGSIIMSDTDFDKLEEQIKLLNPKSKVLNMVGYTNKEKVILPYPMMSLDKKKEQKDLDNWLKQSFITDDIIISDKLDGVSIMLEYYNNGSNLKLYTRGNGIEGGDITKFVKYLNIPQTLNQNMIIRGEIILSNKIFKTKYSKKFENARNLVSGIVNKKKPEKDMLNDLDIITYELYFPEKIIYSKQLEILHTNGFKVVSYFTANKKTINKNNLTEYLKERLNLSNYKIDGIVIYNDSSYTVSKNRNPKYAFAFKTTLYNENKNVIVKNIEWNVSKHGYLKPRILFDTIRLDGVNVKYTTGFNAKYIKDNKIGPGSILKIIRSGDVIPHILEVVKSTQPQLPINIEYKWHSNNYEIMLINSDSPEQIIKNLTDSFKKIKVKGLDTAIIKKLYNYGADSIIKILNMTESDFLKLPNFKETLAKKIYNNIQLSYNNASINDIMNFSNKFGEGFGKRRIDLIIKEYPDIIKIINKKDENINIENIIKKIERISGFANKTATLFVTNLISFIKFYKKLPRQQNNKIEMNQNIDIYDNITINFKNKNVVFSGMTDSKLEDTIKYMSGYIQDNVNNKTDILIVKSINKHTNKFKKAQELNKMIIEYSNIFK